MTSTPSTRGPEPPSPRATWLGSYKTTSTLGNRGKSRLPLTTNPSMMFEQQLRASSESFFDAFASNKPSIKMLCYFSTTSPVIIQHTPDSCPHPHTSRLVGSNAIRSYFDLLATHWTRSNARTRATTQIDGPNRRVIVSASIDWAWRKSGRKWTEDFTWTLDFDESLEIVSFVIRTVSGPGTCVMRAIDIDAEPDVFSEKHTLQASVSSLVWRYIILLIPKCTLLNSCKYSDSFGLPHLHWRRVRVLGLGLVVSSSIPLNQSPAFNKSIDSIS